MRDAKRVGRALPRGLVGGKREPGEHCSHESLSWSAFLENAKGLRRPSLTLESSKWDGKQRLLSVESNTNSSSRSAPVSRSILLIFMDEPRRWRRALARLASPRHPSPDRLIEVSISKLIQSQSLSSNFDISRMAKGPDEPE